MRILGLHDGQTSGAAVLEGGRLVMAVNEERLVRLKQARGFPRASIARALEHGDGGPGSFDAVAVAQRNMAFSDEIRAWGGWFQERETADDLHTLFFRVAARYSAWAARLPFLRPLYYGIRTPHYARRRRRIRKLLRDEFGLQAPVRFVHHHRAHAAAAYHASGFEDALVVTMDGGGDGHSSHVYSVRGGRWDRLATVDSYDSLGNYYAYVTHLCGFKAKKHEGKITGLAAHGRPLHRELLERLIEYGDGGTVNQGGVLFQGALERIRAELPGGWRERDLAASIQGLAEDLATRHVSWWLERTGHRNVALAGGLFANVRINQAIHEIPRVDRLFVFPGMTDEGLAAGAAWILAEGSRPDSAPPGASTGRAEPAGAPRPARIRLPHVHLGPAFDEAAMEAALTEAGLEYRRADRVEEAVADRLARGAVVARFTGRMEFGPRALGHRSILYQPTDPTVQAWLNELLDRTEFMPFAPSVLLEEADRCFEDLDGARDAARFMTITFRCTRWMREHCPAVVHVDGTARPQLVDRAETPSFWRLIDAYRRRTGLPAVINTSFNMHEEPIVCSPSDAVRAFRQSGLDFLALGPFLARGERGTAAVRRRHGPPAAAAG